MDEVIFEEFKGTGNMEIVLSREISDHRVFPAIDVAKSNTRKKELLQDASELAACDSLRRMLLSEGTLNGAKLLVELLNKYPSNKELLASIPLK